MAAPPLAAVGPDDGVRPRAHLQCAVRRHRRGYRRCVLPAVIISRRAARDDDVPGGRAVRRWSRGTADALALPRLQLFHCGYNGNALWRASQRMYLEPCKLSAHVVVTLSREYWNMIHRVKVIVALVSAIIPSPLTGNRVDIVNADVTVVTFITSGTNFARNIRATI